MKPEELTPELIEQAKQCTTRGERLAFLRDNAIELTDEQLATINGAGITNGVHVPPMDNRKCLDHNSPDGRHHFVRTGKMVSGSIFGDLWPNYETRCEYCGLLDSEFAW